MTAAADVADARVPGYLGRVLDGGGAPVGTCFQVAPGVLVTAWHVLDDIGAAAGGACVRIDPLAGGAAFAAAVARVDSLRDLAVLTCAVGLPAVAGPLWATDRVPLRVQVTVTGHVVPDDPGHVYRFLDAPGEWAGGTTRDEVVPLGRMTSRAVVPGMSGGPVICDGDGAVAGVVSGRYNSADGWLAGTVWVARTEDLAVLLDGIAEVTVEHRPQPGPVAGRPLEEVTDPFALEVHRPVQPEDAPPGLPILPPYVPREYDQVLGQVLRAAAGGCSGIAVLVGGSSTGKTRACWEALALLRTQDPPWRLWHPIDPTRPDAALRELRGIGPRTVVWLNEAQFYLDPVEAGLGERVAAGLRELLRDPCRAPVLVLATVWPEFWHALTARPVGGDDRHAQARELLAGHDISVPVAFTPAQLGQLARWGDARLALAAAGAQDGQVIQFLAGTPELLARYRNAPPAAAALINAAMDARRLGMGVGLPQAFLAAAAPGYLTGAAWDALGENWKKLLKRAWKYAREPCKGVSGPLARPHPDQSHPRPGSPDGDDQPPAGQAGAASGPQYRLADYLDQYGRAHRNSQIPPVSFWDAAADHALPADQVALGAAADARGLYRAAAQLHKNAATSGNLGAAIYLSNSPPCLRSDARPAFWAATHVSLDDPGAVAALLEGLREAGADEQATALLRRDPAAHVSLDDPWDVAWLLEGLRAAGADEQATALARRAAAHVSLDNLGDMPSLLDILRAAGADEQATALARRAAADTPLDNPSSVVWLLDNLRAAGADEQATALLDRDPAAHVSLDNPFIVKSLLDSLRKAGADEQAAALAARAAAHVSLDDPDSVANLLDRLQGEQAAALARRAAAHVSLDDPGGVARLLISLRVAGADEQAAALLDRDPAADAPLDDPGGVARLLGALRVAGADEQAAALLDRDPAAHAPLDNPYGVARLLIKLREAGADEQATALLDRDPAAHVSLGNPHGVFRLLRALREAGADEQATALANRVAAHAAHDNPADVAFLLDGLRVAGAHDQAAALADQLPAAGMFDIFLEQHGHADQFRFGREADGSPSAPWGWEDLDLWVVPDRGDREATLPVGLPPTRRIRKVSLDSSLSGRPELHCEAQLSAPAPRSLRSDRTVGVKRTPRRWSRLRLSCDS